MSETHAKPVVEARGLVKHYGRVVALDHAEFDLRPGEILGVIGDNGAGKSTLIKALSGAVIPDSGEILLDGKPVHFKSPMEARNAGIETVYQNLALSPALSIADNMFLGREMRKQGFLGTYFRRLDRTRMQRIAREKLSELGLMTIQNIGSAALGLAYASSGRFDLYVHSLLYPWDMAAGIVQAREGGGRVLDRHGGPVTIYSEGIIAGAVTPVQEFAEKTREMRWR